VVLAGSRYIVEDAVLIRRHRQAIGTITSNASISISWLKGGMLGVVEESFIGRLRPGEVFVFGGRALQLVRLRDSIAYVRLASGSSRYVPRWQGARMPLSVALGRGLLELLGRHLEGTANDPELTVLQPILALQQRLSAIPTRETLLVEVIESREGFHLFVYPFAGRLLNEGVASVLSLRAARSMPRTFSITSNDYGFELLCESELVVTEEDVRHWLTPEGLDLDLLASINVSDLARRQFRDIARIAGLVDPGTPRRGKTARQLQVSSGLMFDVLERHDAANLLLDQARREVLDAQLEHTELKALLERIAQQRLSVVRPARLTPFAFPLWADRLQTQTLSTESWQSRVEREAKRLEKLAR